MSVDQSDTAPAEYSLSLGDSWEIVPSEVGRLQRWVRARVESATDEPTGLEETFIQQTTADLRRALASDAELIAMFAEVVPGEPRPDAPPIEPAASDPGSSIAVLSAVTALAFLHRSAIEGVAKFTPGFVRLGLRRDPVGRPLAVPREITTDGGTVVETRELVSGAGPLGQDALKVTYYKPLADGEWLGILTFQTPNVEVEAEWLEVFRAMADTLRADRS